MYAVPGPRTWRRATVTAAAAALILCLAASQPARTVAQPGTPLYDLWLHFLPLPHGPVRSAYAARFGAVVCTNTSSVSPLATACAELSRGLDAILGSDRPSGAAITLAVDASSASSAVRAARELSVVDATSHASDEEYTLASAGSVATASDGGGSNIGLKLSSPTGRGVLFGVYRLLSAMQRQALDASWAQLPIKDSPDTLLRFWNIWDNLSGPTEYQKNCNDTTRVGGSVFHWDELPGTVRPRYADMARILASAGLNAIVLNNVNSCIDVNEQLMSSTVLRKAAALAGVFARYGISSFLSPCFGSPQIVGGLPTSDPLNSSVAQWWQAKATEALSLMPNGFRGYLIKADSEGQPGPWQYNRTLLDGANMLADSIKHIDGLLVWRSFMHPTGAQWNEDQAMYLYRQFVKFDGQWRDNVVLQTKTGPFDFQVHEPVQTLFGALKHTNLIMEVEVSQTFTGQGRHPCHLGPQWESYLTFDTEKFGAGSPLGRVLAADNCRYCGLAGINNLFEQTPMAPSAAGGAADAVAVSLSAAPSEWWTVSAVFGAANTLSFGRMAWHPQSPNASAAAAEWAALTFPLSQSEAHAGDALSGALPLSAAAAAAVDILLPSWLTYENITGSVGLGYICDARYHYWMDPDGWDATTKPPDNGFGGGFNASNASFGYERARTYGATYGPAYAAQLASPDTTPLRLLLTFHNVEYTRVIHPSGYERGVTVLQAFYDAHTYGVASTDAYHARWAGVRGDVDAVRWSLVDDMLTNAAADARNFTQTLQAWFTERSGIPPQRLS